MGERLPQGRDGEELGHTRLLTEVDHLVESLRLTGGISPDVEDGVRANLFTAVQEIAMPFAVTTTVQRAEEREDQEGRHQRIFTWLGRSAIQVAESGIDYHFSPAAYRRVGVEIDEARHSEAACRPGIAQPFISPRMSAADAPAHIAKAEHLYDDDAVRVAYAVTDTEGRVTARRLESLLVRDVPLEAWVAMLKSPQNIFGKAFELRDEQSALPVMELFSQLELPEADMPEGPVTLVEAVLPYIKDNEAYDSVQSQLQRFRRDQALYKQVAERKAEEWLQFEKSVAISLHQGVADYVVEGFIATMQDKWGEDDQLSIRSHIREDGRIIMTRSLAARLEKAKQNVLNAEAAIVTGNDKVLAQMDVATQQRLREHIAFIEILRANGADEAEIRAQQAQLTRDIADQNLKVGGGCAGENAGEFASDPRTDPWMAGMEAGGDKKDWKWKRGVCRVRQCPSPKPTEVGPCDVCRNCQHVFDSGGDPTVSLPTIKSASSADGPTDHIDEFLASVGRQMEAEEKRRQWSQAGQLALVGATK